MADIAGLAQYLQNSPQWQQSMAMLAGEDPSEVNKRMLQEQMLKAQADESRASQEAARQKAAAGQSAQAMLASKGANYTLQDILPLAAVDPQLFASLYAPLEARQKAGKKDLRFNPVTGEVVNIDEMAGTATPVPYSTGGAATPSAAPIGSEPPVTPEIIPPPAGLNPKAAQKWTEAQIETASKDASAERGKSKGREGFTKTIDETLALADDLHKSGGMIDDEAPVSQNLATAALLSDAGQYASKAVGTKGQTKMTQIRAKIPAIIQDIKNATGMTAQQMNSDRDIQLLLDMVGDPTASYQSFTGSLKSLRGKYGAGNAGDKVAPAVVLAHPKFGDVTEEDIAATMKAKNMTRAQVLQKLGAQ